MHLIMQNMNNLFIECTVCKDLNANSAVIVLSPLLICYSNDVTANIVPLIPRIQTHQWNRTTACNCPSCLITVHLDKLYIISYKYSRDVMLLLGTLPHRSHTYLLNNPGWPNKILKGDDARQNVYYSMSGINVHFQRVISYTTITAKGEKNIKTILYIFMHFAVSFSCHNSFLIAPKGSINIWDK